MYLLSRLKMFATPCLKKLHSKRIGIEMKVTPVISVNEEDKLWASGMLSMDSPIGLLKAVFFYNGKHFCLRGGQEQEIEIVTVCKGNSSG